MPIGLKKPLFYNIQTSFTFKTFPALAMVWEFPAVSHTRYDFWKAKQYTQSGMWWFTLFFGVFGLHHYMMRSPQTGMIFFLTNVILCGYPLFYDLIQLSSAGNTLDELNEYGLSNPFGPMGMAQGMWLRPDEKEDEASDSPTADSTSATKFAAATAAMASAAAAVQMGGGEEKEEKETPPNCPKDKYSAPNPWMFLLYNLCVPISPLAHVIGGNRERALTRLLYLFAGVIFMIVCTIIYAILWLFLPTSISDIIWTVYILLLPIVSCAYLFAIFYDYFIMFFSPTTLFFNSKECNLNGFVGYKEDPPCPSTQDPMAIISTVFKPLTNIIFPIIKSLYNTGKSVASGLYAMTPMGRAEMVAKLAAGAAHGKLPGGLPVPGLAVPGLAVPGLPVPVPGLPNPIAPTAALGGLDSKKTPLLQKGGAMKDLEPLDFLGAGVIGAVLTGALVLSLIRNASNREIWLNDTPPNPRRI